MMGEKDPLYGLGDPLPPLMSDIFLDNGKKKNKNKDPLDSLLFSDPMTMALKKENRTDSDELDKTGTEEEGTEDDEDWTSSAPPLDYLERVKGYETVGFDTVAIPPPIQLPSDADETSFDESKGKDKTKKIVIKNEITPHFSKSSAKDALLNEVSKKCCYGTTAAKQMVIKEVHYQPAYHYELQTYVEKRETNWTYAPHKGGSINGPSHGRAPLPWEIVEEPTSMFKDEVRIVSIPHTDVIKACHKCRGTGGMTCRECSGKGWTRCLHCHGDVYMTDNLGRDRCYYCQHSKHGHGQQDCSKCQARGKVNCATCEGSAYIRCFLQLSISWKVVTAEHIVEKLNIPEDLIRDVSGQVAFEEEHEKIEPIDIFNEEIIKTASTQLVNKHQQSFTDSKILKQRHQVRIVPVSKVTYEWKSKKNFFFVYGYEEKIYIPSGSYPQSCCWGCVLL